STGDFSGYVRIRGVMASEGVVLGTLLSSAGPTYEWGKEVRSGFVGHYLGGHECDSIHNDSLSYSLLTISQEDLDYAVVQREMKLPADFWSDPKFSAVQDRQYHELHFHLRAARKALENPEIQNSQAVRAAVLEETLELYLRALATLEVGADRRAVLMPNHFQTVRKTEDYLRANSGRPVQLAEIAYQMGVSQTSLNRAFKNTLNMSPIAYLRRWRLTQVRRCITEEAELGTSVSDAAIRFGFWELGRFSGQYKELFGELPSTTLNSGS
ncbi:MAG: helix-turn-helix domain-containing protein, partial [Rhizobiaceae bacterium]